MGEAKITMKLYDFAFSPNCRKVRAVAYELGVSFEPVHVDLFQRASRAPEFLELNPNGRVPVLVDDDLVLWESTAIMRYLTAKCGGDLVPATARAQAELDRWLAWQLAHLGPAMTAVAFERIVKRLTGQGAPNEAVIATSSADFAHLSKVLDAALSGRDYLAGSLSLADFALASHYSLAPLCGLSLAEFPHLESWLTRVLGRDSMRRALADAQAAMRPHAA
ncbi:glutathione S-transferase family protein [Sorangium sp. So ce302]